MTMIRMGRLAALGAVLVLAAACADQPEPLAPSLDVSAALVEGELTICKAANVAGSFDYDWTITRNADNTTYASGTTTVAAGSCELIASIPTNAFLLLNVSVTEAALPADWSLTSIGATFSHAVGPVPVVDLATRNISNVRLSHDVSATITFTNLYTPPPPPPPTGCTYTQGYWKTHSEFGPAPYDATWAQLSNGASTTFYLSGMTWYQVFHTAPKGNAYYNLAHQFMAAKLSILSGASSSAVTQTMIDAEALLNAYTPAQIGALKGSNALRQQFGTLAETLDDYNNGLIGPGHCN